MGKVLMSKVFWRFGLATLCVAGSIVVTALSSNAAVQSIAHQPDQHQKVSTLLIQPQPTQLAQSRRIRIQDVWQQVYAKLPDLPKENQYVALETGEVAEDDTLIGRLIRYHLYAQGRSPLYRLDWKLTLADYLGVNEVMYANQYPSRDKFSENPMDSDRTAVRQLTLAQRETLVTTLANIFNPQQSEVENSDQESSVDSDQPSRSTSPLPPQSQPGDADLLKL
ncbi:MAG: hypothetical protein ACFBSC_15835 [Microcoleaceae cyanobacterium]